MVAYTLGLALGPNSIGWAVLDEQGRKLRDTGVRVFRAGVDHDPQGREQSRSELRRIARGMRRQIARRARRKAGLRRALVEAGLLPEAALLPAGDPGRTMFEREQFRREDPYELRSRALRERLELHEIGRVLLHLNQRRGFLSNKKAQGTDQQQNSEFLAKISTLAAELGDRQLGTYLADLQAAHPHVRLRGRHTHRAMLEAEFQAIWEAQARFHPGILTRELCFGRVGRQCFPRSPQALGGRTSLAREFGLYGIIFFQRPGYWPKSAVCACELEPKHKRCRQADRRAQRFRLLQEVNQLQVIPPNGEPRSLLAPERSKLIIYLERSKARSFDDIRNHLGMPEEWGFNLEVEDRRNLFGIPTDAMLSRQDLFGKDWHDRPDQEKTAIVRTLLEADDDVIRTQAQSDWRLDAATAERLLKTDLGDGYARYCREAIDRLLPYLERGLPLQSRAGMPSALQAAGYLRADQHVVHQQSLLPEPPEIPHSLMRKAIHELRKVVNALVREYGRPGSIHLELAGEVKVSAALRLKKALRARYREQRRQIAAAMIREQGETVTREKIDRYLLWEEQRQVCFYSFPERPISLAQLWGADVTLDHVLPYAQSLDDSLMNKVVCFRDERHAKGPRTPREWLAGRDPTKYEAVLQRAAKLPMEIRNRKRPKFSQESVALAEVISSQLVDTAYVSQKVAAYLACLGAEVVCCQGRLAAELRRQWELNSVLQHDAPFRQNREDYRHQAVAAVVIALMDSSRLQQLARTGRRETEKLPPPWEGFRDDVARSVNDIAVSHRTRRSVSGPLHGDTHYGRTAKVPSAKGGDRPWARGWIENDGEFVHRKPLESLTLSAIEFIRDARVRQLVIERLAEFGLAPGGKGSIPNEVWTQPLVLTRKPGRTASAPAIIKKVRLIKRDRSIRAIRNGTTYVKPGSIHHACVFELPGSNARPKRDVVFVSMLEAHQRVNARQPIVNRIHPEYADAKFIMSICKGDMLLAEFQGQQRPVVVSSLVSTQKLIRIVDAIDARPASKKKIESKSPSSLRGRKITVDPLGRIRWAND